MKTHHLFWGIFFLVIGCLIFIDNYTSLILDWDFIINLWPAILVVIGVSIIVRNSQYRWILAIISSLLLSVIIFAVYKNIGNIFNMEFDEDFSSNLNSTTQVFSEPYNPDTKTANLYVDATVGNFQLKKTTNELVDIYTNSSDNYTFERNVTDGKADIYFEQEKQHFNIAKGWFKKQVRIRLNESPVWDMDYDIGTSKADIDLTSFKVDDLFFKSGASSIRLKIGDKQDSAHVKFQTGVSKVNVYIPKETGCIINANTELTNKHFNNFQKVDDHTYRTVNYYSAKKKVFLDFKADVSSVRVDSY